jgi:hypothetical protein
LATVPEEDFAMSIIIPRSLEAAALTTAVSATTMTLATTAAASPYC